MSKTKKLKKQFRQSWDSSRVMICLGTPEDGYTVRESLRALMPIDEDVQEQYEFFESLYVETGGGFDFAAVGCEEHWGHDKTEDRCYDGPFVEVDPDNDEAVRAFIEAVLGPCPEHEEAAK